VNFGDDKKILSNLTGFYMASNIANNQTCQVFNYQKNIGKKRSSL